ncbi:helix-turn-helix domain-containing protein [Streptomyces coffeae]|uniref:helix-turn-helix domain-containing protein n=1 Tax=Streptomyces coffeae TaxID=621382 RepID=UPI0027DDCFD5|nr:helix-turn-helix domain-containing protein [Streptomyces coffeae]
MPAGTAVPVVLTAAECHRLKKMAYSHKTPHQSRQRATIVLLAARGRSHARIAAQTRTHVDTVGTWRGRFAAGGLPALPDRKRSGRPPPFTPLQVAEVKTRPRPPVCWTCTPVSSAANPWARTSTSSPATRRPPSRPAAAAIRPWCQGRPGRCASTTTTNAAACCLATAFPNAVMVHTPSAVSSVALAA